MKWLKSYCSFLFVRPWKELRRSRWYMTLVVLPVLLDVLSLIGLFLNIRIPLPDWSNKTWTILFLLSVILTLLLLIEGLRRYDIRTTSDLKKEWENSSNANKVLSAYIALGDDLYHRCKKHDYESDTSLVGDITDWHRGAASAIVYEAHLDPSYRDRFYKDSDTGKKTPPINECLSWVHTRVTILKEIRHEIMQPPPQIFKDSNIQKM